MKENEITTIDNLKEYLEDYCKQYPEDDCCGLVEDICNKNEWIYTQDSELNYDDEDWVTDGEHILSYTSEGWTVFDNEGIDMEYEGSTATIREDADNWYVDFNTGLGEGIYPKTDWSLKNAIYDQAHIYDENK